MSAIACIAGEQAGQCKAPEIQGGETIGRRIYIHQDSLTALAARGVEEATLVYRMAARTVALKAVHHVHQDASIFGFDVPQGANDLRDTINLVWSENTTQSLARIAHRPNDPRNRTNLYPILENGEEIAASCYFSNYYTFATGAKTAAMMFDDTNDIATMRLRMRETSEYADLTLLNGHGLVLIDPALGHGLGVADLYFKRMRPINRLTANDLLEVKFEVFRETKESLQNMIASCLQAITPAESHIAGEVLKALDYAFTKGILATPNGAISNAS